MKQIGQSIEPVQLTQYYNANTALWYWYCVSSMARSTARFVLFLFVSKYMYTINNNKPDL